MLYNIKMAWIPLHFFFVRIMIKITILVLRIFILSYVTKALLRWYEFAPENKIAIIHFLTFSFTVEVWFYESFLFSGGWLNPHSRLSLGEQNDVPWKCILYCVTLRQIHIILLLLLSRTRARRGLVSSSWLMKLLFRASNENFIRYWERNVMLNYLREGTSQITANSLVFDHFKQLWGEAQNPINKAHLLTYKPSHWAHEFHQRR